MLDDRAGARHRVGEAGGSAGHRFEQAKGKSFAQTRQHRDIKCREGGARIGMPPGDQATRGDAALEDQRLEFASFPSFAHQHQMQVATNGRRERGKGVDQHRDSFFRREASVVADNQRVGIKPKLLFRLPSRGRIDRLKRWVIPIDARRHHGCGKAEVVHRAGGDFVGHGDDPTHRGAHGPTMTAPIARGERRVFNRPVFDGEQAPRGEANADQIADGTFTKFPPAQHRMGAAVVSQYSRPVTAIRFAGCFGRRDFDAHRRAVEHRGKVIDARAHDGHRVSGLGGGHCHVGGMHMQSARLRCSSDKNKRWPVHECFPAGAAGRRWAKMAVICSTTRAGA